MGLRFPAFPLQERCWRDSSPLLPPATTGQDRSKPRGCCQPRWALADVTPHQRWPDLGGPVFPLKIRDITPSGSPWPFTGSLLRSTPELAAFQWWMKQSLYTLQVSWQSQLNSAEQTCNAVCFNCTPMLPPASSSQPCLPPPLLSCSWLVQRHAHGLVLLWLPWDIQASWQASRSIVGEPKLNPGAPGSRGKRQLVAKAGFSRPRDGLEPAPEFGPRAESGIHISRPLCNGAVQELGSAVQRRKANSLPGLRGGHRETGAEVCGLLLPIWAEGRKQLEQPEASSPHRLARVRAGGVRDTHNQPCLAPRTVPPGATGPRSSPHPSITPRTSTPRGGEAPADLAAVKPASAEINQVWAAAGRGPWVQGGHPVLPGRR